MGSAEFSSNRLSKGYDYQILAATGQLGLKYRWRAGDEFDEYIKIGIGFNFLLSYELIKLSTEDNLQDNINGSFKVNDVKFSVGATLLF